MKEVRLRRSFLHLPLTSADPAKSSCLTCFRANQRQMFTRWGALTAVQESARLGARRVGVQGRVTLQGARVASPTVAS